MDIDVRILNKIFANQIRLYIKRIVHYNQVGFVPRMQGAKMVQYTQNQCDTPHQQNED